MAEEDRSRRPVHWPREVGLPLSVAVGGTVIAGWLSALKPLEVLLYIGLPALGVALVYLGVRSVLRLRSFLLNVRTRQRATDATVEVLNSRVKRLEARVEGVRRLASTTAIRLDPSEEEVRTTEWVDAKLGLYPDWVREAYKAATTDPSWHVSFESDYRIMFTGPKNVTVMLLPSDSPSVRNAKLSKLRQEGLTF